MKYLIILLSAALTACTATTAVDTANLAASAVTIQYEYESGEVVDLVKTVTLTDEELATLEASIAVVEAQKDALNAKLAAADVTGAATSYALIKQAYVDVRAIVVAHYSEYDAAAQVKFVNFDSSAQAIDTQYQEIQSAVASSEQLTTLLQLADSVATLATVL